MFGTLCVNYPKEYGVMVMSEFPLDFGKYISNKLLQRSMGTHIRVWMGIIQQADHFIGCDSVGQHIAYAFDKTVTVIIGSHVIHKYKFFPMMMKNLM